MKRLKSLFGFTSNQQKGIFLLLVIIAVLQAGYLVQNRFSNNNFYQEPEAVMLLQQKIDSIRAKNKEDTLYIFPFNPNYITDFKGYTLGLSNAEIDRLLAYRAGGKWVNTVADFQEVTQVSDSLLQQIAPYFKFPDWVNNSKTVKTYSKPKPTPTDLNRATAKQLQVISGIGKVLSKRIVNYRAKLGGAFTDTVQLREVYGLSSEVIKKLNAQFPILTPAIIKKYNINVATVEELVAIPYINYELAYKITEARTLRDGFKTLEDLRKVKNFPHSKYDIIILYLRPI